ncbi:hypothetical protein [Burkholderia pseudomallei]|uniref:hypothetical protein n=1 Tax=Burkholderia pseudomallei TaxID=28450 RepID=UPI000A1A16B8|nr:hypothetical protein [Burkholderia pseudomallei]ARL57150.1 hypothetical protein BOC52_11730 [Burkholderia pseudomallei]
MEQLNELLREYAQSIRRDDGTAFIHADAIRALFARASSPNAAGADERAAFAEWCERFPEISRVERLRDAWNTARASSANETGAEQSQAQTSRLKAIMDAIEGECDGLAIDEKQAANILMWLDSTSPNGIVRAHRIDVAGEVQTGWKLMPPKMTFEMRIAFVEAAAENLNRTGGNNPDVMYEAAFAAAPQPPSADAAAAPAEGTLQRDRLLAALERATKAECALRALVDECGNDTTAGWEDRMRIRIDDANRLLAGTAPADAQAAEPAAIPAPWLKLAPIDDVRECLMDVVSHHDNIVAGFAAQRLVAQEAQDSDTVAYWNREIDVAHRMKAQAERALAAMVQSTIAPADERAAFEAWWVRDVPVRYRSDTLRVLRQSRELDGKYGIGNIAHAWEGWQARASSANETGAEGAKRDVRQLAHWLLTDPQTGESLHFAGPLEPDFLRFSRVKLQGKSGRSGR